MENQEQAVATPRQMLHLQVAGDYSQDDLVNLIQEFNKTWLENGTIATPNNVSATVIHPTEELSGMILTPKITALEIAAITVEVLRAYDLAQGNENSPTFAELDEDAKVEILQRVQCALRFGGLPENGGTQDEKTRDALFVATARSLGTKLTMPNLNNMIIVTRFGQADGEESQEIKFSELVEGDQFKYGESEFVAESNPYVNWIAQPFPVVTIDAKVLEVGGESENDPTSTSDETPVQSLDSNS